MSNNPKEERAAGSIADPFIAAFAAGRLEKQAMGNAAEGKRFDLKPEPIPTCASFNPSGPPVFPDQSSNYSISDKPYSRMFGSVKVSFYQYYKQRVIRAVARKNGVTKELIFTPEIASDRGVVFDMVSAIEWVKEVGFKHVKPIDPNAYPARAAPASPPAQMPPQEATPPPPQQRAPAPPPAPPPAEKAEPAKRTKSVPVDPNAALKPPMEGEIVRIGAVEKAGWNGNPGYTTFAITVREKFRGYEKEFIGEHLASLTDSLGLAAGMSIRIQFLGKMKFSVDIGGGRWQDRTKNEYSIVVL